MDQDYNATVIKKDFLSEDLCLLTVKPDFEIADFKPGQFTILGLKAREKRYANSPDPKSYNDPEKIIKKAYSILSSPAQERYLEFYLALVHEGELTPRLFSLESGDRLFVGEKITGKFTLDNIPPEKNLLMISTGTGLAPFMSMVRTHLVCGGPRKFVILHGARYSYDLGFYSELSVLSSGCKNLHYIPCISRPQNDPNWGGPKGRVTEVIKTGLVEEWTRLKLAPENFDVLLCGNPAMIEEMIRYLESLGFKLNKANQPGHIYKEEFW